MPGEIRQIANFLDIPIDESSWSAILEHCSFDWMKENASKTVPLGGAFWEGGPKVFINKGVNGRWSEVLTDEDCAGYEAKAEAELGLECARWVAKGNRETLAVDT